MAENKMTRLDTTMMGVQQLIKSGASDADINAFLKTNGYTPERYVEAAKLRKATGGQERSYNALDAGLQGLTMGFSDELGAGVDALRGRGTYDQALAARRAAMKKYQSEYPGYNMAAEMAGSLLPVAGALLAAPFTGGASTAAVAPSLARTIGRSALTGAATGAVTGAGTSEGSLTDRLTSALGYGAVGGALGAAAPVAMSASRKVATQAKTMLGLTDPAKQADHLILTALERDKLTPSQVASRVQGGKPETIADLAGVNTGGKMAAVGNAPGQARTTIQDFLTDRNRTQSARVASDIEQATGQNMRDTNALVRDMIEQRKQKASPLYEAAYAAGGAIDDPAINKLLGQPYFKEAYARAQRIAQLEGRSLPKIYEGEVGPPTAGQLFRGDSLGSMVQKPDLQTLDYIKRGLDDVIYGGRLGESSIGKGELRALKNARNEFVTAIDNVAPKEYQQARAAFAGDTKLMEAVTNGQSILDLPESDYRELMDEFSKLTPDEQMFFRRGAVDAVRQKMDMAADKNDVLKRIFYTPKQRGRLEAIMPDQQSVDLLRDNLGREARMVETGQRVMSGSRTAPLAADMADNTMSPAAIGELAATGGTTGLISGLISSGIKNRWEGITEDVANNMAGKMTMTDPLALTNYLQGLDKTAAEALADAVRRGQFRQGVGGVLGAQPGLLFQ